MKSKTCEQRSYASDVTAEGSEIIGNPVVCGVRTQMYDYVEIIEPGALTEADISDVLLTVNHNLSDIPLARSKGGQPGETMQLSVDNYNCHITAKLDVENNPQARALHSAVSRGDITGMSFMFHVKEDTWERENDVLVRHIQKIDKIIDVSAVTIPAYPSTSISARSSGYGAENETETEQAEQRKKAEKLELEKLKLKYMYR